MSEKLIGLPDVTRRSFVKGAAAAAAATGMLWNRVLVEGAANVDDAVGTYPNLKGDTRKVYTHPKESDPNGRLQRCPRHETCR